MFMVAQAPRLWSTLAESTKTRYRREGVTPQRYNAWQKKSSRKKKNLAKKGISRGDFLGLRRPTPPPPTPPPGGRGLLLIRVYNMLVADAKRIPLRAPVNQHTLLANIMAMSPSELADASTITAAKWRERASPQYVDNRWYYH